VDSATVRSCDPSQATATYPAAIGLAEGPRRWGRSCKRPTLSKGRCSGHWTLVTVGPGRRAPARWAGASIAARWDASTIPHGICSVWRGSADRYGPEPLSLPRPSIQLGFAAADLGESLAGFDSKHGQRRVQLGGSTGLAGKMLSHSLLQIRGCSDLDDTGPESQKVHDCAAFRQIGKLPLCLSYEVIGVRCLAGIKATRKPFDALLLLRAIRRAVPFGRRP
jgi:hypothetical protein